MNRPQVVRYAGQTGLGHFILGNAAFKIVRVNEQGPVGNKDGGG